MIPDRRANETHWLIVTTQPAKDNYGGMDCVIRDRDHCNSSGCFHGLPEREPHSVREFELKKAEGEPNASNDDHCYREAENRGNRQLPRKVQSDLVEQRKRQGDHYRRSEFRKKGGSEHRAHLQHH